MKRILSLVLATLLLFSLCSVSLADETAPTHLLLLTQDTNVAKYMDIFNEAHNDIFVEVEYVSGGWQALSQKLVTLIAADQWPDITFLSPTYLYEYAVRDQLLDITEYVERDINKADYLDNLWESMSVDGRIYGAPKDVRFSIMWYNKRMFNELKLPYPCQDWSTPWSVEDWLETCKLVSGYTLDETNITRGMNPDWRYCRMMNLWQCDGIDTPLDADGNGIFNDERIVKRYQQIQQGVIDGYIAAATDKDAIGASARFYNGYDSFTLTGNWSYDSFWDCGNLGVCVVPGGVSNYWNDMYCGFAGTQHPDEVWEVLKWFATSEEYWDWAMSDHIANGIAFSPLKAVNEKYADVLYTVLDAEDRACLFGYLENAVPFTPFACYTEMENLLKEKTSLFYSLETTDVQGELDDMNESFQEALDEFYEEYSK